MALNLSAFDQTGLEDIKPKVAGGFKIQDTTENLTMPSAKPVNVFTETFKQLVGVGERPSALLDTLKGIGAGVRKVTQKIGEIYQETPLFGVQAAYAPTTESGGGAEDLQKKYEQSLIGKYTERELAVTPGIMSGATLGLINALPEEARKVEKLNIDIEAQKTNLDNNMKKLVQLKDSGSVTEYNSLAPIVNQKIDDYNKNIESAQKEFDQYMNLPQVKHPIYNLVGEGIGTLASLRVIGKVFAPIVPEIKTWMATSDIGGYIKAWSPTVARLIPQALGYGAPLFGTVATLRESIKQFKENKFEPGKILIEAGKGTAFGLITSYPSILESQKNAMILQAINFGGFTALDTLIKNGKISKTDIPSILVQGGLGALFEYMSGEDIRAAYGREEEGMQNDTLMKKWLTSRNDMSVTEIRNLANYMYSNDTALIFARDDLKTAQMTPDMDPAQLVEIKANYTNLLNEYNYLHANYFLQEGTDYIIQDGKAILINQSTGRLDPGKQWQKFEPGINYTIYENKLYPIEYVEGAAPLTRAGGVGPGGFETYETTAEMISPERTVQIPGSAPPQYSKAEIISNEIADGLSFADTIKTISQRVPIGLTIEDVGPLKGALSFIQRDGAKQMEKYSPKAAEIWRTTDLSKAKSIDEAKAILKKAIPPEEQAKTGVAMTIENFPESAKRMLGQPEETVTVYHGTPNYEIIDKQGVIKGEGQPIFLTTSRAEAEKYTGENGKVYEFQLPKSQLKPSVQGPTEYEYKGTELPIQLAKEVKPEVTKPTVTPKVEKEKMREIYQAEYNKIQKAGENKLMSDIKTLGGLKTDPTLKEEMSDLPINIMRKDGVSPDEMLDMLDARGYDFKSVSDMFDSIRAISSMPTRFRPAESILDQKLTTIQTIRTKMPKLAEVTPARLERLERQILREATVGRKIPPKGIIERAVGLKPEPERMVTKKESQLLKMKLRAEAKGATEGMRQARSDIISQLRITRTDTTDIRKQITDYVKQALDPSDRGKANVLIRDAKNQEDLVKAFSRIDTWAENAEKKAIRNDVISSVRKAIDSPAVAIDYKAKIKEVIDEFELKGHLGRTLQKLEATKKYIDERLAAGEDIEIPQRIWNSLKILTRKPYEDMTVSELKGLQDEVKILDAVGRMKWATYKDIYKLEQTAIKNALIEGTTPMARREKFIAKIGERLSTSQAFKNHVIVMQNGAQKIDKVVLPMDAIFDWLDGAKGTFSGANIRLIKGKIDRGWNLYQTLKDDIQDPVVERAIQLKMKDMNMERIGFVAAREQEGGMDKLKQLGYTEDEVNAVKLTKEEQEMLDMMRGAMEKEYPYVVDIMRKVYNQPVGKVKNYFSFMTDWSKTDEAEIYKRMGPGAEEFGLPTKTVEQGFTIPRRAMAKQKIKLNAMSIFLRHTDNTSYLRSLGRDIKMLFEIVNSDEYQKASGDLGQLLVLEWLDLMARKGGSAGSKKIALIDTMRKNLGAGMIGFKLSSAAVQWTEVIPAMGLIGPEYGMKGIFNISASKDWREFVMKFPEIRNRSGGETAIQELTQGSAFRKLQAKAFLPLEKIDIWGAMSVSAGAYEKKMAELGKEIDLSKEPNQEAMEYAQQIVRRNQGVAGYKDVPLAVSRGALTGSTSIDRAFLQFQNFVLFRWSRIRYEALKAGIDAKDPLKVAGILFWTIMGMIAAVGTKMGVDLLSDFVTGKDTKDVVQAKKFIYEAIGTVPFLGNLYGSYLYDNELIPIFSAPTQALQDLKKAISSKKETTRAKGLAGFITTLMTLMGVPGMLQTEQLIQKAIPTEPAGTKSTMPKAPTIPFPKMPPAPKMPAGPKLNLNNLIKNLLRKELA